MLNSLKEKIIPSLIATFLVGLLSSFITFKVMAYQVQTIQVDMLTKASKELVNKNEILSKEADTALKKELENKADKNVLDLIYEQVKKNGEDLRAIRQGK